MRRSSLEIIDQHLTWKVILNSFLKKSLELEEFFVELAPLSIKKSYIIV